MILPRIGVTNRLDQTWGTNERARTNAIPAPRMRAGSHRRYFGELKRSECERARTDAVSQNPSELARTPPRRVHAPRMRASMHKKSKNIFSVACSGGGLRHFGSGLRGFEARLRQKMRMVTSSGPEMELGSNTLDLGSEVLSLGSDKKCAW